MDKGDIFRRKVLTEMQSDDLDLIKGGLAPKLRALYRENRLTAAAIKEVLFEEINYGFMITDFKFGVIYSAKFWENLQAGLNMLGNPPVIENLDYLDKYLPDILLKVLELYLKSLRMDPLPRPPRGPASPAASVVMPGNVDETTDRVRKVMGGADDDGGILGRGVDRGLVVLEGAKLDEDYYELQRVLSALRDAKWANRTERVPYKLWYNYRDPGKYKDRPVVRAIALTSEGKSVGVDIDQFARNLEVWKEIRKISDGGLN